MLDTQKKKSVLYKKDLGIVDMCNLVEELEGSLPKSLDEKIMLFDSLHYAISELWFKTRINLRTTNDQMLKEEYEIDSSYISDALQILKLKFKDIYKLKGESHEYS